MPALATALTEFGQTGDSKTFSLVGHTAAQPKLLIEKRRVPSQKGGVASMTHTLVYGTKDSTGTPLTSKVAISVEVRIPSDIGPSQTEHTAALAVLKDLVGSDEFAASLLSQNFVK